MAEYISVNDNIVEKVWHKSCLVSRFIAEQAKDLSNQFPDDDNHELLVSSCMQMFMQAIVIYMTTYTALDERDYLEAFVSHFREVHGKLYPALKEQMKQKALELLKDHEL